MQGTPTNQGDTLATTDHPELLTVKEAAQLLRVRPQLLYQKPETIPGMIRLGSMIRYRASDVRAALGLDSSNQEAR